MNSIGVRPRKIKMSEETEETLADKAHRVYAALTKNGYPKWLMGVGQGKDEIIVYIESKRAKLQNVIAGVPVRIVVIGQIKFCSELEEEKEKLDI